MRNRNKFKTIIIAVILVIAAMSKSVLAENAGKDIQQAIWEYEMTQTGVSDYNDYLNSGLVPSAGQGADWLVIYMKESGIDADYSVYDEALNKYIETASELTATDYERIALVKSCLGTDRYFITDVIENQTGQGGIMSIIYGLMLAAGNDYVSDEKISEIADSLTALQLEDGGWNLTGEYSDTDVTAMALQALAPLCRQGYEENIEKGIERLSKLQRDDGGYASFGIDNSESTAQVLMALCALDIDYKTDTRFIKNGNTAYDALMGYATNEGTFSHTRGGRSNAMATTQALAAFVCIDKYEKTGKFIYDFREENESVIYDTAQEEAESAATAERAYNPYGNISGNTIKYIIMAAGFLAVIICVLSTAVKKRLTALKVVIIVAVGTALEVIVWFCRFETVSEHYDTDNSQGSVETYITIKGCDGEIATRTCVYISEGDTVFDQLLEFVGKDT